MCAYIYIYGGLCVFLDGWPRKGSYLRHLWSGTGVSRRPSLSILAQRPHKELYPQKPAWLEEKDERRQSVKSETPGRSVGSETAKQGVGKLDRWPDETAFLVAVGDFRWVIAIWTYIHRMLKWQPHFPAFAVLNSYLSISSFCHLFNVWFVKCPHGWVWELTTESTPLDERPNQRNPPFGYYFSLFLLFPSTDSFGWRTTKKFTDNKQNLDVHWYRNLKV